MDEGERERIRRRGRGQERHRCVERGGERDVDVCRGSGERKREKDVCRE